MKLSKLIEILEKQPDKTKICKYGFGEPMSWRGIYSEIAFEPKENVSIQEMLNHAKSALGKIFDGYKGGKYKMTESTSCHLDNYGCSEGPPIDFTLLGIILEEKEEHLIK